MINPFGGMPGGNPMRAAEIKRWVRQAFALGDDATVMVTELRCTEPGCPPLETCVAILSPGAPTRQHKIFKGMTEVTFEDVSALAGGAAGGCGHDH